MKRYVSHSAAGDWWGIFKKKAAATKYMKTGMGSRQATGTACELPEYVGIKLSKTKVTTVTFS